MKLQITNIRKSFSELIIDQLGPLEVEVDNVTQPAQANSSSLIFITDNKNLDSALAGPAAALVVDAKAKIAIEKQTPKLSKSILVAKNVKLAMAQIMARHFANETPIQALGEIHKTAIIAETAKLGSNVSIGAHSVIGENVTIGNNVRIDACVVIEADAKISHDSHLYSNLYIGPRTEIGERCELLPNSTIGSPGFGFAHDEKGRFYRIPQIGKVVIHNDVEVGANCTIDRATFGVTSIGEGSKIDKLSHIAHNCEIGKHCVFAGKFAVAGSTKIGDHFVSGGRVTVKDGITITAGVEVAGLSGVHNSITEPGQYGGYPLQPVREALKSGMSIAHLPKMRKSISKIMKHLALSED